MCGRMSTARENHTQGNSQSTMGAADSERCAEFIDYSTWFDRVNEMDVTPVGETDLHLFEADFRLRWMNELCVGVISPELKPRASGIKRVDELADRCVACEQQADYREKR